MVVEKGTSVSPSKSVAFEESTMVDDNLGQKNELQTDIVTLISPSASMDISSMVASKNHLLFIKIKLNETEDMLLYENNSRCVMIDTIEVIETMVTDTIDTIKVNKHSIDFTQNEKQHERRTKNVETQTSDGLKKTRGINTDQICKKDVGCHVSNYDMFDTYTDLEHFTESIDVTNDKNGKETILVTTYLKDGIKNSDRLPDTKSASFKLPSMILQRILATNILHRSQCRFRNMKMPSPLDLSIRYLYNIELLCKYYSTETGNLSVSCMSWCSTNSDILAVGYGIYKFIANETNRRDNGYVCIWNIKNPMSPERFYRFNRPVVSLSFCDTEYTQLVAVGFGDGSVQIVDVSYENSQSHVAITKRTTSPPAEPVWRIKWLQGDGDLALLTVTQDGFVMKYSVINSPYLDGRLQMRIQRIQGDVEGIKTDSNNILKIELNSYSQGLMLTMHPIDSTAYFVGTDEGCLHKCSIYYPFQHLNVFRAHKYGVYKMEFSPWSPKIFLTCGTDWCIRIWIENITEPIIELQNGFEPIQCVQWCPSNSTIILSATRSRINIWDIRTNCLRPASSHAIHEKFDDRSNIGKITECQFTKCGRSIVVGDDDGCIYVYALNDIPFAPHYQFNALMQTILKSLSSRPALERQVKRMSHLGYAHEK